MGYSLHACWLIGVIVVFVTHCACVSSSEEGQRLMKDSLWEQEQGDNFDASQWERIEPDGNIIQSVEPIYRKTSEESPDENEVLGKSHHVGSFQDRLLAYELLQDLMRSRDRSEGGMREEEVAKRGYKPRGFYGSRGKRFIPGLESLLLAKYYRADAEKWKRQPHPGFHGSRG